MDSLKTLFLALVCIFPGTVPAETLTFTAKNIHLDGDYLSAGPHLRYPVITSESSDRLKREHPRMTTCIDDAQRPINCRMLFAVGFVDEARITVTDGAVSNLSITVIHQ